MNKYELTVVLNVKLEDEERAAAIEKVKGYITRFGGTVTNVDEWGKKRLAYEIQKSKEGFRFCMPERSRSSRSYYGASDQILMRKDGGLIAAA